MRRVTILAAIAATGISVHVASAADFVWPESGKCTAGYTTPLANGKLHRAFDVQGAANATVGAARAGKVVAFRASNYGNAMVLDHGNGWQTVYVGLGAARVPVGALVKAGDPIATQAKPHVHFAIAKNGAAQIIPGGVGRVVARGAAIPWTYAGLASPPKPPVPPTPVPPPAPAPPLATNLALHKTAVASSNWSAQYSAAQSNDGDASTGWSPTGADQNPWLEIDLGAPCVLASVELVTRQELDQPVTRGNFEIWASNVPDMSKGHVVLSHQTAQLPFKATLSVAVADKTPYRFIAAVKTAHEYFYVTELRAFGRATSPAPPPPTPAPATTMWQRAGFWVANCSGFSGAMGDLAQKNGFKWATVQVHNGQTTRTDNETYFQNGWIAALRQRGISVGGWGYLTTDPERDAQLAADLVKKWGLDHYIADAEAEYKYTSPSGAPDAAAYARSARFVKAFRAILPNLPCAVSSYGRSSMTDPKDGKALPADLDWAAWRSGGFVYMPQAYMNDYAFLDPKDCVDGGIKAGYDRTQIFPTIGIWGGGATGYVPAKDYVANLQKCTTVGFNVYLGEQMPASEWPVLGQAIGMGLAKP